FKLLISGALKRDCRTGTGGLRGQGAGVSDPRCLGGFCRPHLSGLVYASAGGRSRPHSLGERTESSDDVNLLRDSSDRSVKVEALSVFSSLQQQLTDLQLSVPSDDTNLSEACLLQSLLLELEFGS